MSNSQYSPPAKLFMDETRTSVPDPGRGRTKAGWLRALAKGERAWSGPDPLGVVFFYAPTCGCEHAKKSLKGFDGILQVDRPSRLRSAALRSLPSSRNMLSS